MPYTSTTSFYPTQTQIITRAAAKFGILDTGQSLDTNTYNDFAFQMNAVIKEMMAEGIGLWLIQEPTLFLQKGQASYNLGPSGDNWATTYTATTLTANAALNATTITVASIVGLTSGDNIGITQTDGSKFWTTINGAPSGSTVTLASGLTVGANSGANVYDYTTKANRPQRLLYVNRRYTANLAQIIDTPVTIIGKMDYWNMPQKQLPAPTSSVSYTPLLTNGLLEIWPAYDGTSGYDLLQFVVEVIVNDLTNTTDNAYFPTEWANFLIWRLAAEMAPEFEVDFERQQMLWQIASQKRDTLLSYDQTEAPIQFGLLKTGERY